MAGTYSAIIAALALIFSFIVTWVSSRTNQTIATMDIWKAWISKDYREYHNDAFHAIRDAKERAPAGARPKLTDFQEDRRAEQAIGSIKHFFVDVDVALSKAVINRPLFYALFSRSISNWSRLLGEIDRPEPSEFTDADLQATFSRLKAGIDRKPIFLRQLYLRLTLAR